MTNWETCTAVESVPGRLSGAWAFTGTRVCPCPPSSRTLRAVARKNSSLIGSGVWRNGSVRAVLEHAAKSLKVSVQPRR